MTKKFSIREISNYEIEAESMEAAQALWLAGGPTENIWEFVQKSFCEVTERSIECTTPNEDGELEPSEEF